LADTHLVLQAGIVKITQRQFGMVAIRDWILPFLWQGKLGIRQAIALCLRQFPVLLFRVNRRRHHTTVLRLHDNPQISPGVRMSVSIE
jgi:hypothetical protein